MLFSIVTPTYNRSRLVCESIESYLDFIHHAGCPAELIVVDDASTDDTIPAIQEKFSAALQAGTLKLIPLPENTGWTRARTQGVQLAAGQWIVFTDSDDLLNANAAPAFAALLQNNPSAPVVFTRCTSRTLGTLVGPPQSEEIKIEMQSLLRHGTPGECMGTVQKHVMLAIPFEPKWQGFEEITFIRQLQTFGPGIISPLAVRIYGDVATGDRLSLLPARIRRARSMVYGNAAFIRHFWKFISWKKRIKLLLRLAFYLPFHLLGLYRA